MNPCQVEAYGFHEYEGRSETFYPAALARNLLTAFPYIPLSDIGLAFLAEDLQDALSKEVTILSRVRGPTTITNEIEIGSCYSTPCLTTGEEVELRAASPEDGTSPIGLLGLARFHLTLILRPLLSAQAVRLSLENHTMQPLPSQDTLLSCAILGIPRVPQLRPRRELLPAGSPGPSAEVDKTSGSLLDSPDVSSVE
ncbi:MAG: hypothetical protein [Tongren Rhabd tick virus 1]|uniref:Uncharacterized protein n=1 Tax=Tongren Rhabd tick virus 1 TaxID=2972325 RepID=A0A9E7V286_9RHAB|nr:MAG: hypothetical protein [Tongren Rhabd tick virus 1]